MSFDRLQSIRRAVAVDLSSTDQTFSPEPTRSIFVGTAGTLKVTLADDSNPVTYSITTGRHAIRVQKVWKTGTSATGIVAEF